MTERSFFEWPGREESVASLHANKGTFGETREKNNCCINEYYSGKLLTDEGI